MEKYKCSRCKKEKDVSQFYRNRKNKKYGRPCMYYCKDCSKSYMSKYMEEHKESYNEYFLKRQKKFIKENPKVHKARQLAYRTLDMKTECEKCGSTERLEYHHKDYDKPLEVVVLCLPCHRDLHRVERIKKEQREHE